MRKETDKVRRKVFNRQICFFIVLTTVVASIPWLEKFSVNSLIYILLNLVTLVSAFYCFYFLYGKETIALLCAAMYTLSFFRIYTVSIDSNIAEGVLLAVLPGVIFSWYQICSSDRCAFSHVCAILVTLCTAVFWYLSGFVDFLLHGAEDWHYIYMDTIQDKGLYFVHLCFQFWKNKSVFPESMNSMIDTASVGIGFVPMIGLCLFAALWFGNHLEQGHGLCSLTKFVFICAIVTMAMSLNIFPWDQLQMTSLTMYKFIGAIRFPHRFLGWGTLFAVEIYGYVFGCLDISKDKCMR